MKKRKALYTKEEDDYLESVKDSLHKRILKERILPLPIQSTRQICPLSMLTKNNNKLPVELLSYIFSFLNYFDNSSLLLVCKFWKKAASISLKTAKIEINLPNANSTYSSKSGRKKTPVKSIKQILNPKKSRFSFIKAEIFTNISKQH